MRGPSPPGYGATEIIGYWRRNRRRWTDHNDVMLVTRQCASVPNCSAIEISLAKLASLIGTPEVLQRAIYGSDTAGRTSCNHELISWSNCWASLDPPEPEIEKLWALEVKDRVEAVERGELKTISTQEF